MNAHSKWFIRIAAIYALIGALMGSDIAGREDYTMVPAHAHILVVGWLTLAVYGLFYAVFKNISMKKTASLQFWTAILGGGLMPLGMLLYYKIENTATLLAFIIPASVLLIAMVLFAVIVFFDKKIFAHSGDQR